MGKKTPIDVFGPNTLRIMGKAYKRACDEAAQNNDGQDLTEASKSAIAKSVVHGASEGKRDPDSLSKHALKPYKKK